MRTMASVLTLLQLLVVFTGHAASDEGQIAAALAGDPPAPAPAPTTAPSPSPLPPTPTPIKKEEEPIEYRKCLNISGTEEQVCCPAKTNIRAPDMEMSKKYDASAANCDGYRDSWDLLTENDQIRISATIFKEMDVKAGQLLFEWGTGCGTKIKFAEDVYNATGMGIDVSPAGLEYGLRHTKEAAFCLANGKVLGWIPDQAFHHTFSFASMYLLGTTVKAIEESKLCLVLSEMVRITRAGGKVIISGNLAGVHLPEAYFTRCYKRFLWKKYFHALSIKVHRDYQWFPQSMKKIFGRNGPYFKSFSVVMKRMA